MLISCFDWNDYLTFASHLVSSIKQEAAYRIATSRAYYAAYWKARQVLVNNGATFPDRSSHEFCWKSFSAVYNKDGDQIAKLGFALRARRIHADYEDTPPLGEKAAITDVQDASDLIDALNNLTSSEQQTATTRARQIYPDYIN